MQFSLAGGVAGGRFGGGGWQYVLVLLLPLAIYMYVQWTIQSQLQQMQNQLMNPQQFQQAPQGYYPQQPGYSE